VDFSLTDDQVELQSAFGRFFDQHAPISVVREVEPLGFSDDLWRRIGEMGVPDLAVGTDGEDAASLSQLLVVAEELGRTLAPVPFVETVTAARAIARGGATLPAAAAGEAPPIVTFCPRPLTATLSLLPAGAIADAVVGLAGDELVLARFADEAPKVATKNLGSQPLATRSLGETSTVLSSDGAPAFERALDDWKVLTAGALVGLALRAHEIALGYVKERKAFGVPIGWFQTVAHRLADSINDLDGARFLTHKAAWAIDVGDEEAPALASMAFAYVTALSERVTAESLHFHGGIGYTREHDIQLYFRRAKAWPLSLGDPRSEYQTLADRLFGPIKVS
jgi:alkylation response protein AidB-like acyl-CoA dehydrogenase